jgi:transcriptional regulator with XRE-family HTH domain
MRIERRLVAELRHERSWSQDELATAAGLNLRTIQRIENVGAASLQSLKAIASALEVEVEDFFPEKTMSQFEHKTVVMSFKLGVFKQGLPDIQKALNKEGQEGWQCKQIIMPSSSWGSSDSMVAVLERKIE